MTKDDIIRMAKEADLWGEIYAMQRFAKLVAAAEREACAMVAMDCKVMFCDIVAKYIRARGKNT